ncbi:MAG: aldehyde dehydrogenase family protein [Gammaproteobacteria bacterium]|jgi:aldehyde dehydrogenase (NAD+)|nr:aldehyde dehydrogenase family protein [Gammaproteobacteria bacterium]MDP6096116.1 aldehyde dehydrogenase family protein [Gammaproteobacteria bacterium]MDP7154505.1 aldehyde dehydrogenase family protein [Gammaproteobacteria bacterium]HJO10960.1 aldehyde dehydrogenase family protein [Gammaproteobacteria bacterium]|tara:strand:- start:8177 stop:9607 length:1431 start_codon:yes stop_codon:yes gene_type:complete
MTKAYNNFYINGAWVESQGSDTLEVINPATEEAFATISLGTAGDVDAAANAARAAFPAWSQSSVETRVVVIKNIIGGLKTRGDEMATAISMEMGAPMGLAKTAQLGSGLGHFANILGVLENYEFEETRGTTRIVKEPAGVCGFITPWNWPLNQIACKVAPALAAGCTIVLKPSEIAPVSAYILTEIIAESGLPAGVFNLVNGDGPTVGAAISAHPEIDLVSFTGSTRAGREVAKAAANGIKRVTQELGGKSANIILEDADFARAVSGGVMGCFGNSGQSCNAPTRMLVPQARMDEAIEIARAAAQKSVVGDPNTEGTRLGPVVSELQFNKIQSLIEKGIDEGATLVTGGPRRPEGLDKGYYVQATVFANVTNDMTIAREEIFGPVLSIIGYADDADAVSIANDTDYGLSGYVSGEAGHAQQIARQIRTGMVHINGAGPDFSAPFGGYKKSGNGREWGLEGFEEFLETKSMLGAAEA